MTVIDLIGELPESAGAAKVTAFVVPSISRTPVTSPSPGAPGSMTGFCGGVTATHRDFDSVAPRHLPFDEIRTAPVSSFTHVARPAVTPGMTDSPAVAVAP